MFVWYPGRSQKQLNVVHKEYSIDITIDSIDYAAMDGSTANVTQHDMNNMH